MSYSFLSMCQWELKFWTFCFSCIFKSSCFTFCFFCIDWIPLYFFNRADSKWIVESLVMFSSNPEKLIVTKLSTENRYIVIQLYREVLMHIHALQNLINFILFMKSEILLQKNAVRMLHIVVKIFHPNKLIRGVLSNSSSNINRHSLLNIISVHYWLIRIPQNKKLCVHDVTLTIVYYFPTYCVLLKGN